MDVCRTKEISRELSWDVLELLSFNIQVGWQTGNSASNTDDTTIYIIQTQKFLEGASEASHNEVKAGKDSEQQNPAKTWSWSRDCKVYLSHMFFLSNTDSTDT